MLKLKRTLFMFSVLLLLPTAIYAQEDDGASVVVEALSNLHVYDFQVNMESSNHVQQLESDIELYQTVTEYTDEVQYALNGNFSLQRQVRSLTVIEGTEDGGTLAIERIFADGVDYVQIAILDGEEMIDFEFPRGWVAYQAFIDEIESEPLRVALINALSVDASLEEFDWQGELITQVTEQPRETLNGVEVRVFDVEIDEVELIYRLQMRALGLEDEIDTRPSVPDHFVIETQRRFWIGAEDNLLYRIELTGFTSIPVQDMRIDTVVETTFEFSYGEIAPIVAPITASEID